mmetsp:Transcript_34754/g.78573  ORF Transcript_34754/g.78573 Transcript_34754/m.78573 type:complete len:234 (-) Transcript_34754:739-1440(-)
MYVGLPTSSGRFESNIVVTPRFPGFSPPSPLVLTLLLGLFLDLFREHLVEADHRGPGLDRLGHDGLRAHGGPVPDGDVAQHGRARADGDQAAELRVADQGLGRLARPAERDAVEDRDPVADGGGLADHDARGVIHEDGLANSGSRVDVDAEDFGAAALDPERGVPRLGRGDHPVQPLRARRVGQHLARVLREGVPQVLHLDGHRVLRTPPQLVPDALKRDCVEALKEEERLQV